MIERMPGENTTVETRHEAHESVNKEKRYQQIMEILRENGPLTAKEVAVKLMAKGYVPDAERNHASPRLTEMAQNGLVEPIGRKKCSFTGKSVTVYDLL